MNLMYLHPLGSKQGQTPQHCRAEVAVAAVVAAAEDRGKRGGGGGGERRGGGGGRRGRPPPRVPGHGALGKGGGEGKAPCFPAPHTCSPV